MFGVETCDSISQFKNNVEVGIGSWKSFTLLINTLITLKYINYNTLINKHIL